MHYNHFVLPFLIGFILLFGIILFKFYKWITTLDRKQKYFIKKNLFKFKTVKAVGEVFKEALIHNNIYKKNPLLGYMHMSLAFGWFLLIVVGKIESSIYSGSVFEEFWLGIFFKYFVTGSHDYFMASAFSFIMDFLLLIVLSGVLLALIKRIRSKVMGMKKATNHTFFDRLAILSLWFIFPLRYLAESTSAAIHGHGGFLTGTTGNALASLPVEAMELPLWWAYSSVLFLFFISLPFSRYMHIPTEVLYIFLKKWGAKAGEEISGYTEIQIHSCSRCGLCIDSCQLDYAANINNVQSVYFLRDTRNNRLSDETANMCLMCGRCVEACPVNLELTLIRQQLRNKKEIPGKHYFEYAVKNENSNNADIIYFAGCMTKLTPGIIHSMKKIFDEAGVNFWFMDEDKCICCGRPMRQQGFIQQSKDLISKNLRMINNSGAKAIVTSCPICYKSFTDEYALDIPVYHHSQYINQLIDDNIIKLNKSSKTMVYHDPCELGRGSGVYEEPREIIKKSGVLFETKEERENALCCGSSLSNAIIELEQQIAIRDNALKQLTGCNPDILATSCPMCKKAFIHGNKAKVMDIAEIVAEHLIEAKSIKKPIEKENGVLLDSHK
ncbi:MAG: (Fe-S)-binding protein [Bacteroidales bacterium]